MRTAEGLGIECLYFTGYTPYPKTDNDTRLPHIYNKLSQQINKTALNAGLTLTWRHHDNVANLLTQLKDEGYELCALEQTPSAIVLPDYMPKEKVVILLGREVEGIEEQLLALCDQHLEIPMFGKKESFNVVQASAMALYHIRFAS